ncbi:MAG: FAD-binding oxidoreductase [Rhodothalassiaceae bacterium]
MQYDLASFLSAIRADFPAASYSEDAARIAPHLSEWRNRWHGRAPMLLMPADCDELSRMLKLASRHHVPIVPQGGNTGLVGGGVPDDSGREIPLSLKRMTRVRAVDSAGATLTAEAGLTIAEAQHVAAEAGLLFPLSLASEGSATLGGAAATNAGGIHVLRYGSMRALVLGIEAVMADGSVLDALSPLRKNNSGYALSGLLVGSEGTLGVISALSLRLFPALNARMTALVALASAREAIALFSSCSQRFGERLLAFEIVPRFGLELVLAHIPQSRDPLDAPSPFYVLFELASPDAGEADSLRERLEDALGEWLDNELIGDAIIAQNEKQASSLWDLRHNLSEAQKHEGPSLKHDISVPVAAIPDFLEAANRAVSALLPGIRPCPFGHVGDGNIHYNLSAPPAMPAEDFLGRRAEIAACVNDIVSAHGGSISAEHGIGRDKIGELERLGDPVALRTMRAIKTALDPHNILNPGRVIRI